MSESTADYRFLNIVGFTVDATQPLALFKDESAEITFPLWLDMMDVIAITTELITSRLSGRGEKRELLDSFLDSLGARIAEVLIDGTAGSGYTACVCFEGLEDTVSVKVELVTALLTAIKYKLPVGISEEALSSSSFVDQRSEEGVDLMSDKHLLEMLERMSPEEMGKYPM